MNVRDRIVAVLVVVIVAGSTGWAGGSLALAARAHQTQVAQGCAWHNRLLLDGPYEPGGKPMSSGQYLAELEQSTAQCDGLGSATELPAWRDQAGSTKEDTTWTIPSGPLSNSGNLPSPSLRGPSVASAADAVGDV